MDERKNAHKQMNFGPCVYRPSTFRQLNCFDVCQEFLIWFAIHIRHRICLLRTISVSVLLFIARSMRIIRPTDAYKNRYPIRHLHLQFEKTKSQWQSHQNTKWTYFQIVFECDMPTMVCLVYLVAAVIRSNPIWFSLFFSTQTLINKITQNIRGKRMWSQINK